MLVIQLVHYVLNTNVYTYTVLRKIAESCWTMEYTKENLSPDKDFVAVMKAMQLVQESDIMGVTRRENPPPITLSGIKSLLLEKVLCTAPCLFVVLEYSPPNILNHPFIIKVRKGREYSRRTQAGKTAANICEG